jgi:lipopolysaccharide export LptBFGC system permease protein LptF
MPEQGFDSPDSDDRDKEHAALASFWGSVVTSKIAVATVIIATIAALFSYISGATQANAGLYKNNAAIKKAEAANQWGNFQAKSTKQSLAEFSRDLMADDKRASYQSRIDRYEKEKEKEKVSPKPGSDKLEAKAVSWDKFTEEQAYQNQRWVQAEFARDLATDAKKAAYQAKIDRYEKEKNDIKLSAEKLEAEALSWEKASEDQMRQHQRWAQATTVLLVSISLAAISLLTRKKWLEYAMFVLAGVGIALGGLAALRI